MDLEIKFNLREIKMNSVETLEDLIKGRELNGVEKNITRKFRDKYTRFAKLKKHDKP